MRTQNLVDLPAGPFTPGQDQATFFVFYADDCLLHFELADLTPSQQDDHEANIVLTAMLQVALTYVGKSKDHAALHDAFLHAPWAETLQFYNRLFSELFEDVIPMENYHYFPRSGFYEAVADIELPAELLSLYMMSGSNLPLHQDAAAWELSKKVNSKMHFAATAPAAGVPVPATLVCKKGDLAQAAAQFFDNHPTGVMLKIQGLAGARNVTDVSNLQEAQDYLTQFNDELDVLLQERLDTTDFTEMTVDLDISDDHIRITNVRKILFADGLWVGNYISDSLKLSAHQQDICLRVGEYVRALGYSSPHGVNCGIDFFIQGDNIVVIEINARWTGGLFPTQLIERLGAQAEHSVAFIDVISLDALPAYRQLLGDHTHKASLKEHGFRLVPMGFSPFTQNMDGIERLYVWQVVMGNFELFKTHKHKKLGAGELPTADLITL